MIITRDLLRAIRNDLPMKLTIVRLREHGPITKQADGYFRFQCPSCGVIRVRRDLIERIANGDLPTRVIES